MPFGAAESIAVHEILGEKIYMIDHFSLYESQCQDPALRQMIQRHRQAAVDSYNQMVSYTHDYRSVQPVQARAYVPVESIQYGLRNPSPEGPSMQTGAFSDKQIATAVLSAHKNSAKNHMGAALECADPNIRQMMINGSITCCNQGYETFMYMNQRTYYQVPTLNDHTAKTYLHHYQPTNQSRAALMGNPNLMMPLNPQQNQQVSIQREEYQGNPFLM